MSYTEMLVVRKNGDVESYKEYRNSHLFAIPIWEYMWERYIGEKYSISSNHDVLWKLYNDESILDADRAILASTYDNVVLKSENFLRFVIDAKQMPPRFCEYHIVTIIEDIKSFFGNEDIIGVCWNGTSISCDFWNVPEGDEYCGDSRPYNIFKDDDHWFLYDALDKENKE